VIGEPSEVRASRSSTRWKCRRVGDSKVMRLVAQAAKHAASSLQDRLDADLKARAFELDVNLARALGGGFVDTSPINVSTAPPASTPR